MLQAVENYQVTAFRDQLKDVCASGPAQVITRRLTFPGGTRPFEDEVIWRPDVRLWAYFSSKPHKSSPVPRWFCWFGSSLNEFGLTPSVEVNLPGETAYRKVAGRALSDASGRFYLGHRGGLGGGRGGQLPIREFSHSIRGFVPEEVIHKDGVVEQVFVIGPIESKEFLGRLSKYVKECERLRQLARNGRRSGGQDQNFTEENGTYGTGKRLTTTYDIKRLHGRVVNSLAKKLRRLGFNPSNAHLNGTRPDLYIPSNDGGMGFLFEVKVSSDTHSWFTALGQLVVYSAGLSPKRVLVAPAPRNDPVFARAMEELGVNLVTFEETEGGKFEFSGLESLMTN